MAPTVNNDAPAKKTERNCQVLMRGHITDRSGLTSLPWMFLKFTIMAVFIGCTNTPTPRSEAATLSRRILEAGVIEEAFRKAQMMIELPNVAVKHDIKLVTQWNSPKPGY